jgi:hypothetical protein
MDLPQGLFSTELTVGYVKEVVALKNLAQTLPSFPVRGIIGLIARIGLEVHWHGAIGTDRKAIDQLLKVRPVILAAASA